MHIGIYFVYLQEWYSVFPRDQVLILRLEDYTENRGEHMRILYDFLTLGMFNICAHHENTPI